MQAECKGAKQYGQMRPWVLQGAAAAILLTAKAICLGAGDICELRFEPSSQQLILAVDCVDASAAVYEVYGSRSLEALDSGAWQLVQEDVRAGENGWAEAALGELTSDRGYFAVGRGGVDMNENGVADVRERFVSVYDLPVTLRALGACGYGDRAGARFHQLGQCEKYWNARRRQSR